VTTTTKNNDNDMREVRRERAIEGWSLGVRTKKASRDIDDVSWDIGKSFFSYLFLFTNQSKLFKRQEGDNELNDRKMQRQEDIDSPANRHDN
jgi:hypothetical protein